MHINSLKLTNFRNYELLDMKFGSGYNIIYGNNAQGKTNIIEALYMCAAGRSHRTSRDMELIKATDTICSGFGIELQMDAEENNYIIGIKYEKNEKKKITINEIPVKRLGDLMGHLNAVIFSPEDLNIIKEGPSERRRFLDMTISQLKPTYFYDLQQYARILFQRNVLLKEINAGKGMEDTLEIWNQHLVKTGSRIMKARMHFIEKLGIKAHDRHLKLTNNAEDLKIAYDPSFPVGNEINIENNIIEEKFLKELERQSKKEIIKCVTLVGPQRDDYDIVLNGMSTKQYGSQGQQRTSVLSIKLAEIDIMREERGEYPVLLLDDVMSELDGNRRKYLFDNIGEIQTFITCTDKGNFASIEKTARFFNIVEGKVKVMTAI